MGTTNDLGTKEKICNAALSLLRQDIGYSQSTTITDKCDHAWNIAWETVKTAFKWSSNMSDPSDTPPADKTLRSLLVYSLARDLAIPITGRQDDLKNMSAILDDRLTKAINKEIDTKIASESDGILAQIIRNQISKDGRQIAYCYEAYSAKKNAIGLECENEVLTTLGIASLANDSIARACKEQLMLIKLGPICGLGNDFSQLHAQMYDQKIRQWRKLKLDEARTDDEVLDQLVGGFKGDDSSLCNAWVIYQKRIVQVKAICENAAKEAFEVSTLAGVPKAAANCLAVAKLSPAFGLDGSIQMQEYERMLADYRKKKLADGIDAATDSEYQNCLSEVLKTLDATNSNDPLIIACAKCLCWTRRGPSHGYEASFVESKEREYKEKILQWRKIELDNALKNSSDAVLLAVVGNFAGNDEKILNAFTVYNTRSSSAKNIAEREIANEHNWTTTFSKDSTSHVAYPAFIYLAAMKIIPSCGVDANVMQLTEQKYVNALNTAIAKDLEAEMNALRNGGDPFVIQVIDTIKQFHSKADSDIGNGRPKAQPRGIATIVSHINSIKSRIRKTILLGHDWSFAKGEVKVKSTYINGRYETAVPGAADRMIRCVAYDGCKINCEVKNGKIISREPIESVTYIEDDDSTEYWTESAKEAYIYAVAKAVAFADPAYASDKMTLTNIASEADRKLQDAKTLDAKSGGRTNSYERGRNYIFDVMTGKDVAGRRQW